MTRRDPAGPALATTAGKRVELLVTRRSLPFFLDDACLCAVEDGIDAPGRVCSAPYHLVTLGKRKLQATTRESSEPLLVL